MSDRAGYSTLSETRMKVEAFPEIDAAKWSREINRLFTAYVFFRRRRNKSIELWASCCGEHRTEEWIKRTMLGPDLDVREANHNAKGVCPFCGRKVIFKEYSRLGKRKGLREYRPAVILSASGGDLYVRAYWCRKDYETLNAMPTVYSPCVYIFSARNRSAEEIDYPEDDCILRKQKNTYNVKRAAIGEPFTTGGYAFSQYTPYTVMNPEELQNSDFRYCQYAAYKQKHDYKRAEDTDRVFMRFLTVAAIYPDKVEMLIKSGLGELVEDLVEDRKKHTGWFDWDSPDFKGAFKGMDRQQLREILALEMPAAEVDLWARVRKQGITLREMYGFCRDNHDMPDIVRECCRRRFKLRRFLNYLSRQKNKRTFSAFVLWKDYVKMAEGLGWDLKNETVLLPPRLRERHDEALAEQNARAAREAIERQQARIGKLDELRKKHEAELKRRRRKYNIELGDYFIRVAETGEEILLEGRTLCHCVGGYAERHLSGATTILFLRRTATPEASLYTIEMDGNRLRQIHGFRNDFGADVTPREKMAWILDPWLDWLAADSPRDKDGRPQLPEKKEEIKTA